MAQPIAELWDDFNDGVIDTSKWTVVFGSWSEATGQLCATMPSANSTVDSTSAWSLQQSSAFVEIASFANGAGASAGLTAFTLKSTVDSTDYVQILIDASAGNITFAWVENNVLQTSTTKVYNSTTMRWLRIREYDTSVFFETSPDGAVWTTQFTSASQTWVSSVKASLFASQTGGAATTKCFDNFNIGQASSRIVAVGSEFTVSADGKLGTNRCNKPDAAWPFGCSVSAFNALRRSLDPCGLWVQPPAKQFLDVEAEAVSTSATDELSIITLDLTNPDTCRSMLFYLPLVAGMKLNSTKSDTTGVVSWTLGVEVSGVDNADVGFQPLIADDLGYGFDTTTHTWRGATDYYWTAAPGESTTVEVKVKAFSGDGGIALAQYQARLGVIGMSVVLP